MKAVEFIRMALDQQEQVSLRLIEDMRDAPLTFPTSKGGPHPLWVLGHHTIGEASLIQEIAQGHPPQFAAWWDTFGPGSRPVADASVYPSFDEVLRAFKATRAQTLHYLSKLNDKDLDAPCKACPPALEEFVGTVGKCFTRLLFHLAMHAGQVTDSRRMIGRRPLLGDFPDRPPPSKVRAAFELTTQSQEVLS